MNRARAFHHWLREPALLPKPEVGLRAQIIDRMIPKELRRDPLRGCFIGDRFCAVLAKLGDLAIVVGTGPGAALTIEPGLLIDVEQRFESARDSHLAEGEPCSLIHRR